MEALLGLVFGLAVVAVVGHLIRIAVRAVVRMLTGPAVSANLVAMCPRCGYNWDHRIHGVAPCPACTWPDDLAAGGRFPAPRSRPDLLLGQVRRRVEAHARLGLIPRLGSELMDRANGTAIAIHPAALGGVTITLVGLAVAALVAAVVPGRDPFRLPERGRTAYVYGAEVLLAAAGAHVRLTMPWLFSGLFAQYWPLMLMAVAFVGVGLSELFRRQGRAVLAEPLERTGALLPILPMVAAFWQAPGRARTWSTSCWSAPCTRPWPPCGRLRASACSRRWRPTARCGPGWATRIP